MKFVESTIFTKYVKKYLSVDEYSRLRQFLFEAPDAGDVIQGTGGFRKLRWADSKRKKGKRGGIRIIYYYFLSNKEILLFNIYSKNEADDLTNKTKKALKQFIDEEKKLKR